MIIPIAMSKGYKFSVPGGGSMDLIAFRNNLICLKGYIPRNPSYNHIAIS